MEYGNRRVFFSELKIALVLVKKVIYVVTFYLHFGKTSFLEKCESTHVYTVPVTRKEVPRSQVQQVVYTDSKKNTMQAYWFKKYFRLSKF
jgi:hypothetical protein